MQEIKLTQGKVAQVDDEELQRCNDYGPWCYNRGHGYAFTRVGPRIVYLHRFIMRATDEEEVDHKSGDKLDCQKTNLRVATRSQNLQNQSKREGASSKYKGVHWDSQRHKWVGQIKIEDGHLFLGYFEEEEVAAKAYDAAAIKYFNEFARLNFPPQKITPQTALFDTCADPDVYVLELDNKTLSDFQTLRNSIGEDIRKTIIAIMDYYSNQDQLNIILLSDALEKRQSYIKFTAQLANYLTHNQTNYSQCKVQFDNLTTRLGIFCRKGTEKSALNSNFLGSVTAALRAYGSCEVDTADVPMSYMGNRAALKHLLTSRLGKTPRIIWKKDVVKIFENSK